MRSASTVRGWLRSPFAAARGPAGAPAGWAAGPPPEGASASTPARSATASRIDPVIGRGVREAGVNRGWPESGARRSFGRGVREAGVNRGWPESGARRSFGTGVRGAGASRGWPESGARRIDRRGGPRPGPPHSPTLAAPRETRGAPRPPARGARRSSPGRLQEGRVHPPGQGCHLVPHPDVQCRPVRHRAVPGHLDGRVGPEPLLDPLPSEHAGLEPEPVAGREDHVAPELDIAGFLEQVPFVADDRPDAVTLEDLDRDPL